MSYRKLLFAILFLLAIDSYASVVTVSTHGKRVRDAAFFLIIMLVTFAATL